MKTINSTFETRRFKIYILKDTFLERHGEKRKKRIMRLDYIRSFINVVNCKKLFCCCEKKAFVSQPTISTHIKQLEAEIGSPAFG